MDAETELNGVKTKVTFRKLKAKEFKNVISAHAMGKDTDDPTVENEIMFHALPYLIEKLSPDSNNGTWPKLSYDKQLEFIGDLDVDEYMDLVKRAPNLFGASKKQKKT